MDGQGPDRRTACDPRTVGRPPGFLRRFGWRVLSKRNPLIQYQGPRTGVVFMDTPNHLYKELALVRHPLGLGDPGSDILRPFTSGNCRVLYSLCGWHNDRVGEQIQTNDKQNDQPSSNRSDTDSKRVQNETCWRKAGACKPFGSIS